MGISSTLRQTHRQTPYDGDKGPNTVDGRFLCQLTLPQERVVDTAADTIVASSEGHDQRRASQFGVLYAG